MYQSEYEKALEQVKTAVEFVRDCNNITRCENTLRILNVDRPWPACRT